MQAFKGGQASTDGRTLFNAFKVGQASTDGQTLFYTLVKAVRLRRTDGRFKGFVPSEQTL